MATANKSGNLYLKLVPIMLSFFAMSFVDLVGTGTNFIKKDFGLSDTMAGLFPLMVFLWFLIFSVPTGLLMNRIGRRKTVLISLVVTALALLLPVLTIPMPHNTASFTIMLVSFCLLGIGKALLEMTDSFSGKVYLCFQAAEEAGRCADEILRKANEEAVQILKEAKDLADETIRNFNKYGQGQAPMSKMEKERSRVRDKMSASEKALSMKKKETVNHKVPKKLRIGDSVRVLSMNLKGTVHTLPNAKGDLYVQMGILRSLVNIKDLVLIDEDASPAAKKYGGTSSGKIKMSKAASVSTEINLIGMTVDEAIAHLDKYLDDAYVAHLPSIRIVHGKGTGALRNAVQAHLKNQRYVKSYRMGEPSEGGAGVTIAAFDV